jgi:Prophage protein (DUF1660)
MVHLLCLLFGHRRTPVVFATNRFYCRRCGLALDPDPDPDPDPGPDPDPEPPPEPESKPTARPRSVPRLPGRSARTASTFAFPRSRPYVGPATRARERHRPAR